MLTLHHTLRSINLSSFHKCLGVDAEIEQSIQDQTFRLIYFETPTMCIHTSQIGILVRTSSIIDGSISAKTISVVSRSKNNKETVVIMSSKPFKTP